VELLRQGVKRRELRGELIERQRAPVSLGVIGRAALLVILAGSSTVACGSAAIVEHT